MKRINLLLSLYYKIPNFQHITILSKAFNVLCAKVLKRLFDKKIEAVLADQKNSKPSLINIKNRRSIPIIASLTSFPARIETAHISLEGIFHQSEQPDRVILWLAKNQFPNLELDLPSSIIDMKARGLEINFCDEDLRSHKKYYYVLKDNPNAFVITFDDDLYYERNIIKNLLNLQQKYPNHVIATRAHKMSFDSKGLKKYSKWIHNYNTEKPSLYLMHTSGAGTLFPPNLGLDETFFDKSLILELSPKSDDVWMKVNLIRLGIPVVTNSVFNKNPITVKAAFSTGLVKTNSFEGGKDAQLKKTIEYFNINFDVSTNN